MTLYNTTIFYYIYYRENCFIVFLRNKKYTYAAALVDTLFNSKI